jgi:hypothetical protein
MLLKPFMKLTKFHGMLDRRISGQDANHEVLADVLDPTALADGPEPFTMLCVISHIYALFPGYGINNGSWSQNSDRCALCVNRAPVVGSIGIMFPESAPLRSMRC